MARKRWGMMVVIGVLLAACARPTPTPGLPLATPPSGTGVRPAGGGGVAASGEVAPAEKAQLSFALAGLVIAVPVKPGDRVEAGQQLMQLDGHDRLAAAEAAASLELLNAQQALQQLKDNAPVALAQTQIDLANYQSQLAEAQRVLRYLATPDLEYYQDQVKKAQDALATALENVTLTDVGALGETLRRAQEQADKATDIYNDAQSAFAACPQCLKVYVNAAGQTMEWKDVQKQYAEAQNYLRQVQIQVAQATRQSSSGVATAQDNLDQAQRALAGARQGPDAVKLAQAQADVFWLQTQITQTQTYLDKLSLAGIDQDKLAAAEARVTATQAAQVAARTALAQVTLSAPFTGTVVAVEVVVGEMVVPGQVVIRLADLDHLQVVTTDLSETDVNQVRVGQAATVYVDALGDEIGGQVTQIALQPTTLGGDVVYAVTLNLTEQPAGLRWGMSVKVDIAAEK